MHFLTLSTGQPGLRCGVHVEIRAPSPSENSCNSCLDFIASDATLDRYSEIISPTGWKLDTYRCNPVFQNSHQYGDILFTLGKALITEVRDVAGRQALFQRIQFATDVNPVARIAYGLYSHQFLHGVSVGFIPLRWEDDVEQASAPAGSRGVPPRVCRRKYLEQELLEVSAVGIPANPNALALAYKSGAVEKSDLLETIEILTAVSRGDLSRRSEAKAETPAKPNPQSEFLSLVHQFRDLLRS